MIDAEKILTETYPQLNINKKSKLLLKLVKKLLHEDDFNQVIHKNQHLRGFAFLDKLLHYFKFSYQISPNSYNNIPSEGRLLIVANHPIGTLDGLALVKLIRSGCRQPDKAYRIPHDLKNHANILPYNL